jgi:hypothetical protein
VVIIKGKATNSTLTWNNRQSWNLISFKTHVSGQKTGRYKSEHWTVTCILYLSNCKLRFCLHLTVTYMLAKALDAYCQVSAGMQSKLWSFCGNSQWHNLQSHHIGWHGHHNRNYIISVSTLLAGTETNLFHNSTEYFLLNIQTYLLQFVP